MKLADLLSHSLACCRGPDTRLYSTVDVRPGAPQHVLVPCDVFEDPAAVAAYIATNCEDKLVQRPDHIYYRRFMDPRVLSQPQPPLQGPDYKMWQCVDNFGAFSTLVECATHLSSALAARLAIQTSTLPVQGDSGHEGDLSRSWG